MVFCWFEVRWISNIVLLLLCSVHNCLELLTQQFLVVPWVSETRTRDGFVLGSHRSIKRKSISFRERSNFFHLNFVRYRAIFFHLAALFSPILGNLCQNMCMALIKSSLRPQRAEQKGGCARCVVGGPLFRWKRLLQFTNLFDLRCCRRGGWAVARCKVKWEWVSVRRRGFEWTCKEASAWKNPPWWVHHELSLFTFASV